MICPWCGVRFSRVRRREVDAIHIRVGMSHVRSLGVDRLAIASSTLLQPNVIFRSFVRQTANLATFPNRATAMSITDEVRGL